MAAINFNNFSEKTTLSPDDKLVGFDLNAPNGEKKWKYSTIVNSLSGDALIAAKGSTTKRALADRFADVVNVLDYGAYNNGTNEEATTTAIQDAIDANPGKAIYFPAGTYSISSQIRIKRSSTSLFADTLGSATINCKFDSINSAILIKSDLDPTYPDIFNVTITNLIIDKTVTNAVASVGVELDRVNGARLINSTIANFATQLKISGGRNNYFSNMRFGAWNLASISGTSIIEIKSSTFSGGRTGFTQMFDNCIIGGDFHVDYVVSILGNDYCSFSNCYIASSNVALVRINGSDKDVYDNWFDQCYFDGVKGYLDNPTPLGIVIAENSPTANSNALQNFTDCSFGQLDNAVFIDEESSIQVGFSDCRFTNIYEAGIFCSSNDVDLRITGCTFRKVCSQLPNKQIISISDASSVAIASNIFQFESSTTPPAGTTIIQLAGGMNGASVAITGNVFTSSHSNVTDYVNGGATISNLTITGNASNNATNTIVGNIIGNKANSNVRALDWYEEGTFNPTITFGGGSTSIQYGERVGSATRIGNRVFFTLYVELTNKGTSTGVLEIGDLPYTLNTTYPSNYTVSCSNLDAGIGNSNLDAVVSTTPNKIYIRKQSGGDTLNITNSDVTNTSYFNITGTYQVA